jgi:hypothetical protein
MALLDNGLNLYTPLRILLVYSSAKLHTPQEVVQEWDSPASTDTLTLRDVGFFHSILLEVHGTPVAYSGDQNG